MDSKRPMILLCEELLKPINNTLSDYNNIRIDIENIDKKSLINSIFVYVFALFEVSLNHTLEYFLNAQPKNLENKEIKVDRDLLIESVFPQDIIKNHVENYVIRLSYLSLVEYIKEYCKIFGIVPNINEDYFNRLIEKKATRNLLLHNNLKINSKYIETAGKCKRGNDIGKNLEINKKYIFDSIEIISDLLINIKKTLQDKYKKYTKEKVLRDIWNYLFQSPLMSFDMFWIVENGQVKGFNSDIASKYMNSLSSSEKTILSIWLMQFNTSIVDKYYKFSDLSMWVSLEGSKQEVIFLLQVLNKHPYLLYG
ncbi:hypothetical protein JCM14036_16840 [Desulfotomaculum defluvii]